MSVGLAPPSQLNRALSSKTTARPAGTGPRSCSYLPSLPLMLSVFRGTSGLLTSPLKSFTPRALGGLRGLAGKIEDGTIPENEAIATGMEAKEIAGTQDIFWSREPITGPKGTKENPAIIPSFNDHRVVGLEIEQGVIWFRLDKGPLHHVAGQYFKLQQIDGGEH